MRGALHTVGGGRACGARNGGGARSSSSRSPSGRWGANAPQRHGRLLGACRGQPAPRGGPTAHRGRGPARGRRAPLGAGPTRAPRRSCVARSRSRPTNFARSRRWPRSTRARARGTPRSPGSRAACPRAPNATLAGACWFRVGIEQSRRGSLRGGGRRLRAAPRARGRGTPPSTSIWGESLMALGRLDDAEARYREALLRLRDAGRGPPRGPATAFCSRPMASPSSSIARARRSPRAR